MVCRAFFKILSETGSLQRRREHNFLRAKTRQNRLINILLCVFLVNHLL